MKITITDVKTKQKWNGRSFPNMLKRITGKRVFRFKKDNITESIYGQICIPLPSGDAWNIVRYVAVSGIGWPEIESQLDDYQEKMDRDQK